MLFRSDRKSTRLNSSHTIISYAVFCLKKKKTSPHRSSRERTSRETRTGTRGRRAPHPGAVRAHAAEDPLLAFPPCFPAFLFFFKDPATPEIPPLPLHAAFR